jgi:putative transposase
LGLARSSLYYRPVGVSQLELELMRLIDDQYTRTPFYGTRRMRAYLKAHGYRVNRKRIARLMHMMGLEAIYPKPKLSQKDTAHKVYPYLLRGMEIANPDQVWASDITYIRIHRGFVYLTVIMDWYSRYVLSWEISVTLDAHFCTEALERALRRGRPTIFNTDQGSQFTSEQFRTHLIEAEVQISMDGKGRAFDNIFVERLWRSVKYEEVYLKDYRDVSSCIEGLRDYFRFYNDERPHQALGYKTPRQVYRGKSGSLEDSVSQIALGLTH